MGFRVKHEDGNLVPRYKAILVVKGFNQKRGIDFDEIFSPSVKMSSIHVILVLATSLDLEVEQMDVKTAFLHGDLDEEISIEQPEGFEVKGKELVWSKPSSQAMVQEVWFFYESARLQEDFFRSLCFVQKLSDNDFIIVLLYVDDMIVVGQNVCTIKELKQELNKSFAMEYLGLAT